MNVDGTVERLKPVMAITAEIKTGQQTLISYLLSPLSQSLSNAGHEK
jgi:hemolysin D